MFKIHVISLIHVGSKLVENTEKQDNSSYPGSAYDICEIVSAVVFV